MSTQDEDATLSIPSLAFVAILSFFIIRYFMSSRSATDDRSPRRNGQRFTPAQVEQIAQMFPQLSRRDIMWDLQRNGGSVAATTERILGGRGLDPVRYNGPGRPKRCRVTNCAIGPPIFPTYSPAYDSIFVLYSYSRGTESRRAGPYHAIQPTGESQFEGEGEGRRLPRHGLGAQQRSPAADAATKEG